MLLKTLCHVFETATYFDKLRNLSTNSSNISSLSVERVKRPALHLSDRIRASSYYAWTRKATR